MSVWKKILVSGSSIHVNAITASSLTNDNFIIVGPNGELQNSGLTFDGSILNIGSSVIRSTGATSILSGSFSGSFSGDGTGLTGLVSDFTLQDGNGITDFTFDGSANATVSVELSGSTLTVGADGLAVNAQGITTAEIADNSVTAAKLDHVFTDNGGVAGTFGSATEVPVLTIDEQGRLTTASLAEISTTLDIAGDTGTDTLSLIDGTLTFSGTTNQVVTAVTDDEVTISLADLVIVPTASIQQDLSVGRNLTVTGDLLVNGATTTISTTNLLVEDRFILLNSGSANPDEGGLVIDEGAGTGHALIYEADLGVQRWGFNESVDSTATTANTTAYAAAVVDLNNGNHLDSAEYQKNGNIKVDTDGEIWIFA